MGRIRDAIARWLNIQAAPAPDDDYWYQPFPMPAASGENVTHETALRVSAVYACVRVLAETVASLPLIVYRRLPNGGKERAPEHNLYNLLHDAPNSWQTSLEYREMLQGHLCLRGNAFVEIIDDWTGGIQELMPLHPDSVTIDERSRGKLVYIVREEAGGKRELPPDKIHHIRGLSSGGIVGLNPIELAREAIGLAMATEKHGARLFGNRAVPGGCLEHPGKLTENAQRLIKESLSGAFTGANVHKTMVLEEGMKWHQLGLTNEDAQFLETRKYQVSDIARIFRVPPHMIGDLEKATFSNIEHQAIDFVVHTIRPWLVRWEQAISRDLIVRQDDGDEYFAEFLVDGLLRGDAVARTTALSGQFRSGALTLDEWRDIENRNPLPDGMGKRHFVPKELMPIDKLDEELERAAAPPPFMEPGEPEEDDENEEDEEDAAAAAAVPVLSATTDGNGAARRLAFQHLIEKAGEKLASREIKALGQRAHHAHDDRAQFNNWVLNWYDGYRKSAERELGPIVTAWSICGGNGCDVGHVVDLIVDEATAAMTTGDPEVVLADWRDSRAENIAQTAGLILFARSDRDGTDD